MSQRIHYTQCPICEATQLSEVFEVKDNTVSKENFTVLHCNKCSARITQDVPAIEEIGRYYQSADYISHTDDAPGLINRLYRKVRKKTLRDKRSLIIKQAGMKSGSLLDVGSGTGAFAHEMKANNWEVVALEPDAGAREIAKKQYGLEANESSVFYELRNEQFDAITMWHVLEHVHDLNGYMQKLRQLLKPNGKLFIAVPNYTSQDAGIYKEYWAAYDVPRHLYHFSPCAMKELAGRHGLKIVAHKAMWFDSFYVAMLSSKYKNGNVNYLAALLNGFRSNMKAIQDPRKCSSIIYIMEKA